MPTIPCTENDYENVVNTPMHFQITIFDAFMQNIVIIFLWNCFRKANKQEGGFIRISSFISFGKTGYNGFAKH